MSYSRNEIVTGLFIVGAVGVFALFAFRVGNFDPLAVFRAEGPVFVSHFADIKTLDQGAKVTVAGRRVGSVRSVSLAERPVHVEDIERLVDTFGADAVAGLEPGMLQARVKVEFGLEDPELRFDPATARVSLVQDGFLGRHYLAFYPGHWEVGDAPKRIDGVAPGEREITVTESPGLAQLISSVSPAVRRVDEILKSVQQGVLDAESLGAARRALGDFGKTLGEIAMLFDADEQEGLHSLVLRPLRDLLVHADGSLTEIESKLIPPAQAMLESGPQLVDEARRVVTDVGQVVDAAGPKATEVLDNLVDATRDLDDQLGGIHRETEGLLVAVRGTVDENSPELAETVRRLRRLMWQAEMAARKIRANPAYLLFGDEESDLEAQEVDRSDTWRSGRARPYRQRDEADGK